MRTRLCDAAVWAQPMGENNMSSVLKATRIVHLEQRCHDSECRERRHHDMLCARCVSEKIFAFSHKRWPVSYALMYPTPMPSASVRAYKPYTPGMGARFDRNFGSGMELVHCNKRCTVEMYCS